MGFISVAYRLWLSNAGKSKNPAVVWSRTVDISSYLLILVEEGTFQRDREGTVPCLLCSLPAAGVTQA